MTALHRHDLTDHQWSQLEPLLPQRQGFGGRPRLDDRTFLNAVLWLLRTGAPWRDLAPSYGNWSSIATRFYRWGTRGVWSHLLARLQEIADQDGRIDWRTHTLDTTIVRAHSHAAGARNVQGDEALGRSRGGFSTKIHLKCEGRGKPLALLLTGGERSEMTGFVPLLEAGRVKRAGRGRPKHRPKQVIADRGYSSYKVLRELQRRGISPVIPAKKDLKRPWVHDVEAYKERNLVERAVNRLKRNRRVATRYEKRAEHYRVWVTLACVLEWLLL